jgi:hypothetical protein
MHFTGSSFTNCCALRRLTFLPECLSRSLHSEPHFWPSHTTTTYKNQHIQVFLRDELRQPVINSSYRSTIVNGFGPIVSNGLFANPFLPIHLNHPSEPSHRPQGFRSVQQTSSPPTSLSPFNSALLPLHCAACNPKTMTSDMDTATTATAAPAVVPERLALPNGEAVDEPRPVPEAEVPIPKAVPIIHGNERRKVELMGLAKEIKSLIIAHVRDLVGQPADCICSNSMVQILGREKAAFTWSSLYLVIVDFLWRCLAITNATSTPATVVMAALAA